MKRPFKERPQSIFSRNHAETMAKIDAPFLGEGKFKHSFEVQIGEVAPDPDQPRRHIDPSQISELASSLKAYGQLQPILVREDPSDRTHWIIVAGERRWRAAQEAGWTSILAIPHTGDARSAALVENLLRVDLQPAEEAQALANLIEHNGWTQRQAATEMGMDQARISRCLQILSLPADFLDDAGRAGVPMNVLVGIAREKAPDRRKNLMERALSGELTVAALNKPDSSHKDDQKAKKPVSSKGSPVKRFPKLVDQLRKETANLSEADCGTLQQVISDLQAILRSRG